MSGAAQGSTDTAKAKVSDNNDKTPALGQQKPAATQLEEDDEFEDFPVEDWPAEESDITKQGTTHLWEESWDDDDTSGDFAVQLKEELKKMEAQKRG
ncbi:26S proteasome complex subunit [Elasticomyces elasticus]|nr:26S proteasome complex subunit [Elasticomyces elasticus]KAK4999654.1 26S proteasome complex subunit [Elasticomyces elasticus]